MPPVPSLQTAFKNLLKSSGPAIGQMSQSTPATAQSVGAITNIPKPVTPTSTPIMPMYSSSVSVKPVTASPTTPAIPNISNGTFSTPNSTVKNNAIPTVPSVAQPQSSFVTTPSGVTVNPATGSIVSDKNLPLPNTTPKTATVINYKDNPDGTTTNFLSDGTTSIVKYIKLADGSLQPEEVSAGDNTGNQSSVYNYSPSAGSPALPVFNNATNSLITSPEAEAAYKKYQETLNLTPEEIDAQTKLNALNASAAQAYSNTEGQAIPLEFITGQKAALQRSKSALSVPLESQLALAQAKRQMAMTASKAALDREQAKVDANRELSTKTVSTAMGSTLSRFNPKTGQYENVVNPFGTSDGGEGNDAYSVIAKAVADGRLTQDQITKYGMPILYKTLQNDPGYNFVTQKASVGADSASLKTQQEYADTTSRAYQTATANLNVLNNLVKTSGLNQSQIPLINQLTNKIKAGVTDPGSVAAFQTALTGLRTEYAQVLSRGGQVTDTARNEANSLIPDDISAEQLQKVITTLQQEGANAVKEANGKVEEIRKRIGTQGSSKQTKTLEPDEINFLKSKGYSDTQIQEYQKSFNSVGNTTASSVSIPKSSRLALVNNNPGNLKFANQDGATLGENGFAKFKTPEDGLKALENQIKLDASRNLTLAQFVSKYAPPTENDTGAYLNHLISATGAKADTPISQISTSTLVRAVAKKESSTKIT